MSANTAISPSQLSIKDLPWQIEWNKDRCTLCGQCCAVCPMQSLELGTFRKRTIKVPAGFKNKPENEHSIYYGIRQRTAPHQACVGCGTCSMVCPNDAILPMHSDEKDKLRYHVNLGGQPRTRGGRRNDNNSLLDQIKFIRISMLTDPALDSGRHEFDLRTLIGRIQSPAEGLATIKEHGWAPPAASG